MDLNTSVKLGLLLHRDQVSENGFQGEEDIFGFKVNYLLRGLKLSASFRSELELKNIERIVKHINQHVELGKFEYKGQEIIFYEFFVEFSPRAENLYWVYVLSQTQKFNKTLKKYLNVFKYFKEVAFEKLLTVSYGIAKLSKSKYVSIVDYTPKERQNFDTDLQIISRIMKNDLYRNIIPYGSNIKPYKRIKYYCENYHLALLFNNKSLIGQNEVNLLNLIKKNFIDLDLEIKDPKRLKSCSFLLNNQIFMIPDCHLCQLFGLSTQKKTLSNQIKNDNESQSTKFTSFSDIRLLFNKNLFTLYAKDQKQAQKISTIYNKINRYNHELIVQFYGTFSDSSKTYTVFENHCIGNLSKILGKYHRSKDMKVFSNIILKLIEFIDWIRDKPISKYFLFSSLNISYLDSKLKISPNIHLEIVDYSLYPPEELLVLVLYKNPEYTRLLLQLFRYSKASRKHGCGKEDSNAS